MIRSSVWPEVYCSARLHCTPGANVVMWSAWFPSCQYRQHSDCALTLHRRPTHSPSRRQWWTSLEFTGASVHLLHLPLLQDFTDYFVCFPVSEEILLCALSTSQWKPKPLMSWVSSAERWWKLPSVACYLPCARNSRDSSALSSTLKSGVQDQTLCPRTQSKCPWPIWEDCAHPSPLSFLPLR